MLQAVGMGSMNVSMFEAVRNALGKGKPVVTSPVCPIAYFGERDRPFRPS